MAVFFLPSGNAASQHESPMRNPAVIPPHFFLADKVNGGIVICKIIGHGLDGFFHLGCIGALLQYHKALPGVLLTGGQFRVFSGPYGFQGLFHRNGVLFGVLYTRNPAHGVGVSLADAPSPKGVVFSFRQNGVCIHAV